MSIRRLLLLTSLLLLSCKSRHQWTGSKAKNRVERIEYKNFKEERISESGISIVYKYYKNERLDSIRYFNIEGKAIQGEKQNTKWGFEYDNKGNYIRRVAYDQNDEICDVNDYYSSAIEVLEYNAKNQLIKRKKLDKFENPTPLRLHDCSITAYTYNELGQLLSEKNFNAEGHYIQDGRSLIKYAYHEDGSLSNRSYLYRDSSINLSTNYTYQKDLIKEETFNREGERISYSIYHYNKEKISFVEAWDKKRDSILILKERFDLDLDGWIIKPSDLKKIKIKSPYFGAFDIEVDEAGQIIDILPIVISLQEDFDFYVDFYEDMRSVKLERDSTHTYPSQSGKLFFYSLRNVPEPFDRIQNILHPSPAY